MRTFEDKFILISGASRGLGRQLAIDFAHHGAKGIAIIARNEIALREVRDQIQAIAPKTQVLTIVADLTKIEDIERIAATTLSEFTGLDVLINNASIIGPSPLPMLVDYPTKDFKEVLATNLIAPFLLTKQFLPALIASGGAIINVTSDAGIHGYPGWGAYGISKFGIEGLSQTWAAELEDAAVRVNLVDPGDMNTEMHRLAEPAEDPNQWADPATVTEVFLFLASDAAKNISGRRFHAQAHDWLEYVSTAV